MGNSDVVQLQAVSDQILVISQEIVSVRCVWVLTGLCSGKPLLVSL